MNRDREFSKAELERYSRQILLYGLPAQRRLSQSHVMVIGAGGLGSAILPALAASGIGRLSFCEADFVDGSNLGRQTLYREKDIGRAKGEIAREILHSLNPHIECKWIPEQLQAANAEKYLSSADFILEGSDDIEVKFLVNDQSLRLSIPLLIGAIGPEQGNLVPVIPGTDLACYRCLFEQPPDVSEAPPSCRTTGVLSTLPALIGAQMSHLAILHLLGRMRISDWCLQTLEGGRWRQLHIKKRDNCPVCH